MIENIPNGAETFEIDRLFRIVFEIFSETHYEVVNGAGLSASCVSATNFQKLASRDGLTPVGDKKFQKPGFLFGQVYLPSPAVGGQRVEINPVVSELIYLGREGRFVFVS